MPEDKKAINPENTNISPESPDNQGTIDFSKFGLSAENQEKKDDKVVLDEKNGQNVMAQLNAQIQEKENDVELNNLSIEESKSKEQVKVELGTSGIGEIKKRTKLNKFEILMISYVVLLISLVGSVLVNLYSKYFKLANDAQVNNIYSQYIETYKDISKTISKYTNINDYDELATNNTLLITTNPNDNIKGIINSPRLNYVQKKDIIQNNIATFSTEMINNKNKLNDLKNEIMVYGFIPKDLYDIIQQQEGLNNIKNSMILMENIKFITAFKTFGYMQSFVQSLSSYLNKNPLEVEEKLNLLNSDGEKQIITYTNNCYFNPYEISYDCDNINDFDNYYKLIDTDSDKKMDLNFLKKLAYYVDNKLQQTDIPTFSITFPDFNPKQTDLSFSLDINTNMEDELALSKQGILNPHLFIVTNLINLLRESLLIIGENIKADQIRVNPKVIRIGSTTFNVNNTTLNLTVPIQKQNQREISDFFMINK